MINSNNIDKVFTKKRAIQLLVILLLIPVFLHLIFLYRDWILALLLCLYLPNCHII